MKAYPTHGGWTVHALPTEDQLKVARKAAALGAVAVHDSYQFTGHNAESRAIALQDYIVQLAKEAHDNGT